MGVLTLIMRMFAQTSVVVQETEKMVQSYVSSVVDIPRTGVVCGLHDLGTKTWRVRDLLY